MNRLALVAATGFLALVLSACGESGNKQPASSTENNAATQPQPQPQPEPSQPASESQNH